MMMKEHKTNLKILRDFMAALPPESHENFDMEVYCVSKGIAVLTPVDAVKHHDCGASMCLIGWTSSIPEFIPTIMELDKYGDGFPADWGMVSRSLFGCHQGGYEIIGNYLFSYKWGLSEDTNTVEHALQRIDRVLNADSVDDYAAIVSAWDGMQLYWNHIIEEEDRKIACGEM